MCGRDRKNRTEWTDKSEMDEDEFLKKHEAPISWRASQWLAHPRLKRVFLGIF